MSASREAVYGALFALLQGVPGLKNTSRRLVNVQDVAPESLPAAYQLQGEQMAQYQGATPTRFIWKATWLIYVAETDQTLPPSSTLNPIVDAAVAALAPPAGDDRQTLGGLVEYAALEGTVQVFEGVLGDRAVAVLPISIVLPGF
jgi:hypothetical protein